VAPLFDELGLRILGSLSGDARFHEVQTMHRAQASMVVCSNALLNVARKLESDWGVPFFEGSFYGITDTSQALRDFARLLGDDDLAARTEAMIAREEPLSSHAALEPWRARLAGKRALLYTGGVKSGRSSRRCRIWAWRWWPPACANRPRRTRRASARLMGDDADDRPTAARPACSRFTTESGADVLIAGGRNLYTAMKARIPFLDINQENANSATPAMAACWNWCASSRSRWNRRCGERCGHQRRGTPRRPRATRWRLPERPMPEILKRAKPLAVNPLKASQPIGAALAFLGLRRTIPMLHGSQGCTAFGKVFLVRHFREPIPLQTTAMDQVSSIMSADENVIEGLRVLCEKSRPEIIGLPTTGLSETQGCDVPRLVREFRHRHPEFASTAVVPVNTPDYSGCLESGFALAVEAIIDTLLPAGPGPAPAASRSRQVNVLASSMLTPGDIEAIKEWIEAFGLQPVVLPDLGDSLDGHLIDQDSTPLTLGGRRRPPSPRSVEPPPRSSLVVRCTRRPTCCARAAAYRIAVSIICSASTPVMPSPLHCLKSRASRYLRRSSANGRNCRTRWSTPIS
jgi:nitrogenase molybdenum-cofactor synthesis protein NifE